MSRRKGELSPAMVDRDYPHQIALPHELVGGDSYNIIRSFCHGLSLASRGHSFYRDNVWHSVFCFAERADAEKFHIRFGGEWFDPARRGRGANWAQLRELK